jgi:riboflavin kinase/FMN adenylyltransferase
MKTYFGSANLDDQYPPQVVVAIGNFDGVHKGHQEILARARAHAKRLKVPVVAFTFNPHPTLELRPQSPMKLLMTYAEKRLQLEKYGADVCVEESFDRAFADTPAYDFFFEILIKRLHAVAIVVGQDFAFGNRREGTLFTMRDYCTQAKVELDVVSPVILEGQVVSSSRVRELLANGELKKAEELLGHPFFYRGEIVHGDKRGRTIGFPTANMSCEEKFPLQNGVYATSVFWRGKTYRSVTNIGTRPTFQTEGQNISLIPIKIETHILNETFDLYGEILEVRFHARLREEKKFDSINALIAQIQSDVKLAESILSLQPIF